MLAFATGFTALERAVLAAICEMHSGDQAALAAQLSSATRLARENTGCGFFTRFTVDRVSNVPVGGARFRNGPQVKIDGLAHGMGSILWLKEGYADCLEAYSFAEPTLGIALEAVEFEILPR